MHSYNQLTIGDLMSDRPTFLTVTYSDSGLTTMGHEKKMIREKDVKFDNEDGILELTDVRIVWYKKPKKSRFGGLGGLGAVAGAIAGAVAADVIGSSIGGIGGRAIRRAGHAMANAAIGAAVYSWTAEQFYNKGPNGETESLAVPLIAISNAQQSGKNLVIELASGGTMIFSFKQPKVIPALIANIRSAQDEGKCPYCGASAKNAAQCPNCGAQLGGSGVIDAPSESPVGDMPTGSVHITVHEEGGVRKATVRSADGEMHVEVHEGSGSFYCPNCGQQLAAGSRFCNKCGYKVA